MTERLRLYLAGPMTGLPEHNYPAFNALAAKWRDRGYYIWNPTESFNGRTDLPRNDYLRNDIRALVNEAQAIMLMPGWEHSPGARLELAIAQEFGLPAYDSMMNPINAWVTLVPSVEQGKSRFDQLLDQMRAIHAAKRSDYTGTSGDILHNYRTSARLAGIPMHVGIFARLCEKVVRISSIFSKRGDVRVKDESVTDTFLDLSIISLLSLIAWEEESFSVLGCDAPSQEEPEALQEEAVASL